MKKMLVISWCSILLGVSYNYIQQNNRFSLQQHFLEHKAKNNNLTYITFLIQHYITDDNDATDDDRDMQLPGKSFSGFIYHAVISPKSSLKLFINQETYHYPLNYFIPFSKECFLKIWHPPQS